MIEIKKQLINATPRSNSYNYFGGESSGLRVSKGSDYVAPTESDVLMYDSMSFFPTLDVDDSKLYVDLSTYTAYVYNPVDDNDPNPYKPIGGGGVNKIEAGDNIDISPTSGVGIVKITSSFPSPTTGLTWPYRIPDSSSFTLNQEDVIVSVLGTTECFISIPNFQKTAGKTYYICFGCSNKVTLNFTAPDSYRNENCVVSSSYCFEGVKGQIMWLLYIGNNIWTSNMTGGYIPDT